MNLDFQISFKIFYLIPSPKSTLGRKPHLHLQKILEAVEMEKFKQLIEKLKSALSVRTDYFVSSFFVKLSHHTLSFLPKFLYKAMVQVLKKIFLKIRIKKKSS